jgi:tetratricopeptide (TPR) repeat protein
VAGLKRKSGALALFAFVLACPFVVRAQDQTFKDAFALYQAGSIVQARDLLLAAEHKGPSALDLSLLGSIEFQAGDFADAERHLRRALSLNSELPGTRLTFASLLEAEGKMTLARQSLSEILKRNPYDIEALLALTRVEIADRQLASARNHAERALKIAPTDNRAVVLCARTRNLQGDSEGALALLISAQNKAPADPALLYAKGVLCLQMDLVKDATTALEKAAQVEPNNPSVQYALASARIATHDFPGAIRIYQDLRQSGQDNAQVNYALGATYFLEGNSQAARPYFDRSVELQPEQVESYYYLGLLDIQANDAEKGIPLLEKVILRQPEHLRAHVALGMAYRSQGRLPDAARELETAVRLDPHSQKAHYQLGLTLSALKRQEQAKAELEIAGRLRAAADDKVSWELAAPPGQASQNATAQRN